MNIAQVKETLKMPELALNTATDADGKPIPELDAQGQPTGKVGQWLRHWDNDSRTAVSIHKDLFNEIVADNTINTLGLQKETRSGDLGDYTAMRIVKYAPAEFTL